MTVSSVYWAWSGIAGDAAVGTDVGVSVTCVIGCDMSVAVGWVAEGREQAEIKRISVRENERSFITLREL